MGAQKSKASSHEEGRLLLEVIRNNLIGKDAQQDGPFGRKTLVYCDYTASGRSLQYTEDFILTNVLPFYANTHSASSALAQQTTLYRQDARKIIARCVNASDDDAVIFTGSGTTGGVHKAIHALRLDDPEVARKTVVFIGPFEHHSNILPWKETGAKVIRIKDTKGGIVDFSDLCQQLVDHKPNFEFMIGAFSAASNVTGIETDTVAVSEILHSHGALALWDYATAAPYLKIDMNPPGNGYKDAVYFSPHKFIGGVGTPGVLVAKRTMFKNEIPGGCGGGTVVYVSREKHKYIEKIEEREEGGTPAIVESVRAGLTLLLKEMVGTHIIEEKERQFCRMAFEALQPNRNIEILGSAAPNRLPIFSILVVHPQSGKLLHHNFVARLLNDLYGLQVRGGCACAGPYAADLLNMTEEEVDEYIKFVPNGAADKNEGEYDEGSYWNILKPGFVRFNLAYFLTEETVRYILHAVNMVASHGWKLLPFYEPDLKTGEWRHKSWVPKWRSIGDIFHIEVQKDGPMPHHSCLLKSGKLSLERMKADAAATLRLAHKLSTKSDKSNRDDELDAVLGGRNGDVMSPPTWFLLPGEARKYLARDQSKNLDPITNTRRHKESNRSTINYFHIFKGNSSSTKLESFRNGHLQRRASLEEEGVGKQLNFARMTGSQIHLPHEPYFEPMSRAE
ncbi:hypothetical protein CAPTEDRAFT_190152 [Capitella teleta]|uniref:Aminotransferase class V domain-containing protein n=1 Tax=Capitella teleta TaxID=283909 RepID=R7UMA2_CAPTE|nr:hypothetical protein CAPTEDRAFT_190152 [Capitella teleta]|eukprot:ELU07228.1 hypothetical protein CAPTEDRAFT_190152 [Capitella teleta]